MGFRSYYPRRIMWGLLFSLAYLGVASAQSRTIRHIDSTKPLALGQGYLAETDELRQPCVTGDRSFVNRTEGSVELENALTQEQLDEDITAKFSGGINAFIASAKVTNKLSSLVNEDNYKRRFVYKGSFRTKTEMLANPKANALGDKLIGLADVNLSIANCGKEYVESIEHGGDIYIALEFDFASRALLNEISTRVEFKVLGIKKVKEFSKSIRKYKSSIQVSVDAFQIGGNPARLQRLLDQYPSKYCRIDAIDRCEELIQKLIEYAKDDEQFPAQISESSPIAYTTVPYTARGLSKLVASVSPLMKIDQQMAYEDMINWYHRENVKLKKIADLSASSLVSTKQRNQLYHIRDTVDQNVTRALKAITNCEATSSVCPGERDKLRPTLVSIDETLLTPWRGFFYFCKRNTPEQKAGIAAILRTLNQTDCELANDKVSAIKSLDLRGLNLTDLDFVSALTNLEQLDLSRNKVGQLYALSRLPQLKILQANRNEIDSLSGLRESKALQKLSVARNQITTLEPITQLPTLNFLSCYENMLNADEVQDILPLTQKLFSIQEACDYEGDKLVAARKIDRETADIYKNLGFGPSFGANASIIWLNCDVASSSYE